MGYSIEQTPASLENAAARWRRFTSAGRRLEADRVLNQIIEAVEPKIAKLSFPLIQPRQPGLTAQDLHQAARIAIAEYMPNYQPETGGAAFATYLFNTVRFQLLNYFNREGRSGEIHEPACSKELRDKVRRVHEKLPEGATADQIASAAGVTLRQLAHLVATEQTIKPAARFGTAQENGIDPETHPAFAISWESGTVDGLTISQYLPQLSDIERTVIELRYFQRETLQSIADSIGKSRERVRQIEVQALGRLKALIDPETVLS